MTKERPELENGDKYLRTLTDRFGNVATVDVYDVIDTFEVTNPGSQHALKKLLCSGQRGKASTIDDLHGAIRAIERAIDLEEKRAALNASASETPEDAAVMCQAADIDRAIMELQDK